MPCCGQQRAAARTNQVAPAVNPVSPVPLATLAPDPNDVAYFEFRGPKALIVIGAATGTRYYFTAPGKRLPIDARDRQSLSMVRQLIEVPSI